MLYALYPMITLNYFILSFIACLGTLQWTAARRQDLKLSLLGPWGLGFLGSVIGAALVVGGFSWFFAATPGLFGSGLAGGELSTLFAAGGLSALLVARITGTFWRLASCQFRLE
jgi:hypothetical protein